MSERMDRVRKAQMAVKSNGRAGTDEYLEQKAPTLFELMTVTELAGKKIRPVTLIVFAEDGRFKVCVNDRETGRVAFVTLDTCEDVFEHLDARLDACEVEWRASGGGKFRG